MKKLFVPVITLVACLTLTYSTTAYASQEETNTQVMPISDSEDELFPFDPYTVETMPASDSEDELFPFDPYNN